MAGIGRKQITDEWLQELAASGASLSEIAVKLALYASDTEVPRETADASPGLSVTKITWPEVESVNEPGRYMFKLGWLTITAADLAVWKQFPNASFTVLRTVTMAHSRNEAWVGEEFRLGTFELRIDSNYSESEK
jgi:hypothetical protein